MKKSTQQTSQLSSSSSKHGLNRSVSAVGTIGSLGQLFTVYESNWRCGACDQENYATRNRCFRCRKARPDGERNYIPSVALDAARNGTEVPWKEAIDPSTLQVYYYNTVNGNTQWERPVELGPAPLATGWFGRGNSGSAIAAKMTQVITFSISFRNSNFS